MTRWSNRSARRPTSSASSRLAVSSVGSSATSRRPAGISHISASSAARYWRTSVIVPSSCTGAMPTAPGWCTISRSWRLPSGPSTTATATVMRRPCHAWCSVGMWNVGPSSPAVTGATGPAAGSSTGNRCGRATFGPVEGGADELAEQRRRAVGAALELGVRLRAHPERMAGQLDELDQAAVGRGPRAHEARPLELAPVAGVELVAVAVPLGHDGLLVGVRHLRPVDQLGDVGAEAHRAALVGHVALAVHEVDHRRAGSTGRTRSSWRP